MVPDMIIGMLTGGSNIISHVDVGMREAYQHYRPCLESIGMRGDFIMP